MKSITHDVFSLGVGLYVAYYLERPPVLLFLLVVWLALAVNEVIDVLGHVPRLGRPVRSFWTHSVFTAPAWGAATALASAYIVGSLLGRGFTAPQMLFVVGLGILVAYSHLLLDALTEGGVFLGRRRFALAHFRYDNVLLNGAFAALGVLLLFAVFT